MSAKYSSSRKGSACMGLSVCVRACVWLRALVRVCWRSLLVIHLHQACGSATNWTWRSEIQIPSCWSIATPAKGTYQKVGIPSKAPVMKINVFTHTHRGWRHMHRHTHTYTHTQTQTYTHKHAHTGWFTFIGRLSDFQFLVYLYVPVSVCHTIDTCRFQKDQIKGNDVTSLARNTQKKRRS